MLERRRILVRSFLLLFLKLLCASKLEYELKTCAAYECKLIRQSKQTLAEQIIQRG